VDFRLSDPGAGTCPRAEALHEQAGLVSALSIFVMSFAQAAAVMGGAVIWTPL
jgi:hypothetical protein